ncbi:MULTISPECIES: M48 family metalloprotease [unclassified Nocardiopsis]|uniref:M48 family metalloprotease n=1 Tax=Nocardiopsis TaxID=2013 RepID=UPI00387AB39A
MAAAWLLLAAVTAVESAVLCGAAALVGAAWWWGLVPVAVMLVGAEVFMRITEGAPLVIRDNAVLTEEDHPRLFAVTARLCALAGRDVPELRLFDHPLPNSLAYTPPGGRPAVYVTIELLERLDDRRLEAVIAHELAHLHHRDQRVLVFTRAMTEWALRLPGGLFMFAGRADLWLCGLARRCGSRWAPAVEAHRARELDERCPEPTVPARWRTPALVAVGLVRAVVLLTAGLVILPLVIAGVAQFAVTWPAKAAVLGILVRRRELAADRAAAELTGEPSVLAAALLELGGPSVSPPTRDLRVPGVASVLAIMPFEGGPVRGGRGPDGEGRSGWSRSGWGRVLLRLGATHPSVPRRVAALRDLSAAR